LAGVEARRRVLDHVADGSILLVDHVDDAETAEDADVERLAAGGRIEDGAIERDAELTVAAAAHRRDRRVKLAKVRIRVVQAFGHRSLRAPSPAAAPPTAV